MKLKYTRRIAALAVCMAMLTGCFDGGGKETIAETDDTSVTVTSSVTAGSEVTAGESARSAAAIASEDDHIAEKETKPLTVTVSEIHSDYSPFGASDSLKILMDSLTGVKLLGQTRNGTVILRGKTGYKERFGGKLYDYSGIADTEINYDEESDTSTLTFTIRDDIRFSDGNALTSDDVIFTLYALLDPSREDSPLFDAQIVGADNYRFDSEFAETLTEDELAEALGSEEMIPLIKEQVILPVLEEQFRNVVSLYDGSSDTMGTGTYSIYTELYPDAQSLFVSLYSLDSEYKPSEDADHDTVISDVADMYKGNYKLLASMTTGSNSALDNKAKRTALKYITDNRLEEGETPVPVRSVSGIAKRTTHSLDITVRGSGAALEKALCGIVIAPLHYYGDKENYNYAQEKYGFEKGNAAAVYEAHRGEPLGAGAYKLTEYKDGEILLAANESYYAGKPLTAEMRLIRETSDSAAAIADGIADISFADGSARCYDAIDEANRKLERIYPAVSDDHGYGYIGINAKTVNVGGQPLSDESSALRKGIMTAINCFGSASVADYYGEHGVITGYPYIENVVIDTSVEGVTLPYTQDKDGEPVYSSEMTDAQRLDAVKKACLGYFEAAGYTLTGDGTKVMEAPEGGRLTFDALAAAGGTGSHPAFYALSQASGLLAEIGITLNVTDISDPSVLWETLQNGTHEIWAGAWNNTLREIYTDGYYGIWSEELEELVTAAETSTAQERNRAYLACYDLVINRLAVELPLYRKTSCILFSTQRIDVSSVPSGLTGSYDWTREIEKLKLK